MTAPDDRQPPPHPAGDIPVLVRGLARLVRLPALERHHSARVVVGLFACVNGFVAIGLMAALALLTGQPFVFPSLGPTAFLLFHTPLVPSSSPRNTVAGHLIGVTAGYLAARGVRAH